MNWEAVGAVAELLAALGVIVSLVYLAVQIRQNTRAVRSASYHQAAEQTWSAALAIAQDESLAEAIALARLGQDLSPAQEIRIDSVNVAIVFGFENMLRLHEQGLLDPDVWENVLRNTIPYLAAPRVQAFIAGRPGPLSARLLSEIAKHADLVPAEPAAQRRAASS